MTIDAAVEQLDGILKTEVERVAGIVVDWEDVATPYRWEPADDFFDEVLAASIAAQQAAADRFGNPDFTLSDTVKERAENTTRFYARKVIEDAILAIHSAKVARQIFEDRDEAIQAAIDSALGKAELVSESEQGFTYAETNIEAAIDAGFLYYIYDTSGDDLVRDEHALRNGYAFKYGSGNNAPDDIPQGTPRCRCTDRPVLLEELRGVTFWHSSDDPRV